MTKYSEKVRPETKTEEKEQLVHFVYVIHAILNFILFFMYTSVNICCILTKKENKL